MLQIKIDDLGFAIQASGAMEAVLYLSPGGLNMPCLGLDFRLAVFVTGHWRHPRHIDDLLLLTPSIRLAGRDGYGSQASQAGRE